MRSSPGPNNGVVLPMVSIAGFETTQEAAAALSARAASALKAYIEQQQASSNIAGRRARADLGASRSR